MQHHVDHRSSNKGKSALRAVTLESERLCCYCVLLVTVLLLWLLLWLLVVGCWLLVVGLGCGGCGCVGVVWVLSLCCRCVVVVLLVWLLSTQVNEEVMHMSTQLHVFIRHATQNWCRVTRDSDSRRLRHSPDPSSTHRCECSRAEKWALNVHADGARKIGSKPT